MPGEHVRRGVVFETDLGWVALVGSGEKIQLVVSGHPTKAAAVKAIQPPLSPAAFSDDAWPSLVRRLQDYAAGGCVDFQDVELDLDHLTPFQRRVIKHCRAIGYGQTLSYGDLAAKSGSQRSARAVGSTMATNRFPLLVPCHRVINSNGSIGNYSGPDGTRRKQRLLDLERGDAAEARRPARKAVLQKPARQKSGVRKARGRKSPAVAS